MATKAKATEEPTEVSSISSWKTKAKPLLLPSGQVIRIRNVGFQAFIKAGIIPNSLMSVVDDALGKGQEPNVDQMTSNPEEIGDMLTLIDEVVHFVAVEPEVARKPKAEKDRKDTILYVDEIDDEDKMFIFGVTTGGTRDVEQFRQEQKDSMAALQRS